MADTAPRAIFLSYASQDAEAARRVADALRGFGMEVWFDQHELRGGDAWDQKIRRQIQGCTLFLPIISTTTQERREGYFRREWKLAADRTNDMAEGAPFIVPVAVDDIPQSAAAVPEPFLRVQWTRLTHGVPTPEFVAQVKRLLEAPWRPGSAGTTSEAGASPSVTPRRRLPLWVAGAAAVAVIVLVGYFALRQPVKEVAVPKPVVADANTTTAPVSDKSIAILPFANFSDDKDSRVFADGVHEDIVNALGLVRDLRVVSRTSVEQYRETKKPMRQIGGELNVAYLLEGSVRRAGNTVRITGQLIRAATDEHVWARKFDRELKDVFDIQAEIATEIAAALHTELSPQEKRLIEAAPTASLDAYDFYLQARDVRNRLGDVSASEQVRLFERAVAIDPKFGKAWARLAWLYSSSYARGDGPLEKATEALDIAEQLIPETPEIFLCRGYVAHYTSFDSSRALEAYRKAAVLSPGFAEIRRAMALAFRRQGEWQKAMASYAEAERLEPRNAQYPGNYFYLLLGGRSYAEAEAALRRALRLVRYQRYEIRT